MKALGDWSIRWRAAGHLLIIFLVLAANLGGVWYMLDQQENVGTAINEAGEQRLLLKQMTLQAHMIGMDQADARDDLTATATEYNRTLRWLIQGNESRGIPSAPPPVRQQLFSVESEWRVFHSHIETVSSTPPSSREFNESLAYIQAHNDELVAESDTAVHRYEVWLHQQTHRLKVLLLILLIGDAAFIGALFFYLDGDILQPIRQLQHDATAVAQGDLKRDFQVVDSDDEIGGLTHSLKEMKDQLVSTIEEARQFEQAVHHAGHAVYITDRQGTIQYVNPAFETMTKYSKEDAVGETPRILNSGHQPESFYEQLWATIKSGEIWEADFVDQRASGELFHAHQTIAPISRVDGELLGFVAIMSDNTDRIVREQQSQVLGRVLRHNLRNELNIIQGRAREIVNTDDAENQDEHFRSIVEHVGALIATSEKAGQFTNLTSVLDSDTEQGVCKVIQRVAASIEGQYPESELHLQLPNYEVDVLMNLRLVLEEIVDNAVRHNDQDVPSVDISVGLEENDDNPFPMVRIEVSDNGPGIPKHERSVIEEGEETPLYHGSGLGLWSIYWSVTLAGGTVDIDSRNPRGTKITVRVPRASVRPFPREEITDELEKPRETNDD